MRDTLDIINEYSGFPTSASKDTLLPCPFCGGEAKLHIRYKPNEKRYALIVCECGAMLKSEDCWNYIEAELKAIEAWNRRAEK